MIDCGEGTQHHCRVSTVLRASRLEAILLTHLHGDHCFGLFGLLHTVAMEGRREPVVLAGPQGLKEMVDTVMKCSGGWFPEDTFALNFIEIPHLASEGGGFTSEQCSAAQPASLGMIAGLSVQAVPLVHSVPDWGYVLTEPNKPGALDMARARELGVPKGPLLGRLKRGEHVTLADGRVVSPAEVIGSPIRGRTFALLQDTSDATAALGPCKEAACVVHEATFEEAMEQDAKKKGHSTSVMAADFARACKARRLVLTHFSARYSTSSSEAAEPPSDPAERLGEEARKALGPEGPPVVVARDFMVLRGDRDFEPEPELALRRLPWHRPTPPRNGVAGASLTSAFSQTCANCGC